MRGNDAVRALGAALLLACAGPWALPAGACGHCIEDKMAATYDYAVIAGAVARRHAVAFCDLRGPVSPADPAAEARLVRLLSRGAGVDAGTVRVSLATPAAAFAFDPRARSAGAMVDALNRALRPAGLQLALIRTVDRLSPPPQEPRAARRAG